jgi:hypothetical protein
MTTLIDLLDCLRAHLIEFEVPALWSVNLTVSSAGPSVSVQLACHQPPEIAAGLLAWADTLTEIAIEVWRVPSGECVHVSVIGQLPEGITIRAYGGSAFTERGIGAGLAPDARTTVPLAVLRAMATPGEVVV